MSQPCPREGCLRHIRNRRHQYCSFICGLIDREFETAERIRNALGPSDLSASLWAEIATLSDTWTRIADLDRRIYKAALAAGYESAEWADVKRGTSARAGVPVTE